MMGFVSGFVHPFGGWDHLVAMLAVGAWAARMDGRWRFALPAGFVTAMAAGAGLALVMPLLAEVETAIALSTIALAALAVAGRRFPGIAGLGLVVLFALFHGHAHGIEAVIAGQPLAFLTGAVLATALLHGTGMALVLPMQGMRRPAPAVWRRGMR